MEKKFRGKAASGRAGWTRKHGIPFEIPCFGASKPVSRVLSFKTAIYLGASLPVRSSRLLNTAGPAYVCSHGVAPDRVYSNGRLTRHWVSSYLAFPSLPRQNSGAVYFCCTFPEVAFGGRYPLSLPCGARTFLMTELSRRHATVCLTHLLFYRRRGYLSTKETGVSG